MARRQKRECHALMKVPQEKLDIVRMAGEPEHDAINPSLNQEQVASTRATIGTQFVDTSSTSFAHESRWRAKSSGKQAEPSIWPLLYPRASREGHITGRRQGKERQADGRLEPLQPLQLERL